jgi:hypothetical protein
MIIYPLLVLVFFATIATGPAGKDLIDQYIRRKPEPQLEEPPMAKVIYLPTAACRGEDGISYGAWPVISTAE